MWRQGGAPAFPLASPSATCDAAWSGTRLANVLQACHTHGSAVLPLPTCSCCGHVCSTEATLSHADVLLPQAHLKPAPSTAHPTLPHPPWVMPGCGYLGTHVTPEHTINGSRWVSKE